MINLEFACDLESAAGYAAHARMMVKAFHQAEKTLEENGINIKVVSRRKEQSVVSFADEERAIYQKYLNKELPSVDVRVFFEPAHFVRFQEGVKTVSFCQWESTRIRDYSTKEEGSNWVEQMNKCDLIMTSGSNAASAYVNSGVTTRIVVNSGPIFPCDTGLGPLHVAGLITNQKSGSLIEHKNRPVVVGYMAQWSPRKNIEAFIRDVTIAFNCNKNVVGLLKTYSGASFQDENIVIKSAKIVRDSCKVASPPDIFLVTEKLTDVAVEQFFNSIDVYYCPSRGEGYNVPAAMAAAAGIPVIAPRYGGHCEFLLPEFLINGSFSPCLGMSAYDSNQFWFNIDEMNAIGRIHELATLCLDGKQGNEYSADIWKSKTERIRTHALAKAGVNPFVNRFIKQIKELCVETAVV